MSQLLPGLTKTHPMDSFSVFLHNPLADEFQTKQMNIAKYIMMIKIQDGYNIYDDLEKLLVDFMESNRVELETHGLKHFLNLLKEKVISDPSNIGIIIYCLNINDHSPSEPQILGKKPGAREINRSEPIDKILTKYTTHNSEEITITIKSICRELIREMFKYDTEEGQAEINKLCSKMIINDNIITSIEPFSKKEKPKDIGRSPRGTTAEEFKIMYEYTKSELNSLVDKYNAVLDILKSYNSKLVLDEP